MRVSSSGAGSGGSPTPGAAGGSPRAWSSPKQARPTFSAPSPGTSQLLSALGEGESSGAYLVGMDRSLMTRGCLEVLRPPLKQPPHEPTSINHMLCCSQEDGGPASPNLTRIAGSRPGSGMVGAEYGLGREGSQADLQDRMDSARAMDPQIARAVKRAEAAEAKFVSLRAEALQLKDLLEREKQVGPEGALRPALAPALFQGCSLLGLC